MKTLEKVWLDRSTVNSQGKRVPTYWNPTPLLDVEGDTVDYSLMAKLTALGLTLELPVGDLVNRQLQRIPGLNVGLAKLVFKAAIADEARHYRGFCYAQEYLINKGYPVEISHADSFLADLNKLHYHPITLAAILEVSCFLPFLALMRLRGGQAFNRLALGINDDEQRHTVVNAGLAKQLGEPISSVKGFTEIRDSILDYLFADDDPDYPSLKDTIYKSSEELRLTNNSPTLNQLASVAAVSFSAPFELENREKYARTTSEVF
jgi:hypothetical protein